MRIIRKWYPVTSPQGVQIGGTSEAQEILTSRVMRIVEVETRLGDVDWSHPLRRLVVETASGSRYTLIDPRMTTLDWSIKSLAPFTAKQLAVQGIKVTKTPRQGFVKTDQGWIRWHVERKGKGYHGHASEVADCWIRFAEVDAKTIAEAKAKAVETRQSDLGVLLHPCPKLHIKIPASL